MFRYYIVYFLMLLSIMDIPLYASSNTLAQLKMAPEELQVRKQNYFKQLHQETKFRASFSGEIIESTTKVVRNVAIDFLFKKVSNRYESNESIMHETINNLPTTLLTDNIRAFINDNFSPKFKLMFNLAYYMYIFKDYLVEGFSTIKVNFQRLDN